MDFKLSPTGQVLEIMRNILAERALGLPKDSPGRGRARAAEGLTRKGSRHAALDRAGVVGPRSVRVESNADPPRGTRGAGRGRRACATKAWCIDPRVRLDRSSS